MNVITLSLSHISCHVIFFFFFLNFSYNFKILLLIFLKKKLKYYSKENDFQPYLNYKVQTKPFILLNANPFFFFFFRPSAWLTPTSLSFKDRFNTSDLQLSNSNLSIPFFVSSSPYLSEWLLHTSSLSPFLLLFLSFMVSKLLI